MVREEPENNQNSSGGKFLTITLAIETKNLETVLIDFLVHEKNLNISMRRDEVSFRPRINKLNSVKDRGQKNSGKYYYA